MLAPRAAYYLENDPPSVRQLADRPYIEYTPQPDWNAAYAYIAEHREASSIVISSMPVFTPLFLGEPGYWLANDYQGKGDASHYVRGDREIYVGAEVVDSQGELEALVEGLPAQAGGYIIYDYMAAGRLPADELAYIRTLPLAFSKYSNPYSQVWVYRF